MELSVLSQVILGIWHTETVALSSWSIRSCLVVRLMTSFTPGEGAVEGLHK